MWETEWGQRPREKIGLIAEWEKNSFGSVHAHLIESVYALVWREHCVECAPPECYKMCQLYLPRKDQKCARFRYGIFRNPAVHGLFDYGADIHFRRWGKLESKLEYGTLPRRSIRLLSHVDEAAVRIANLVSNSLEIIDSKRKLTGAYTLLRDHLLRWLTLNSNPEDMTFDEFVLEALNPGETFQIVLEVCQDRPLFRSSAIIRPGHNLIRIPFHEMNIDLSKRTGKMSIRPDNDVEARVIFTWLDFVRFRVPQRIDEQLAPASKVKCLVWDLDKTLWSGILVEDGPDTISLRPGVADLLRQLDARGIIQSIASKNDHTAAMAALENLRISDLFVCPAINWGPKSRNIQHIATELNIGLDSLAFIDDAKTERAEVTHHLPQVRVYDENEVEALIQRPEFDVPVTAESRKRREFYLVDSKRKRVAENYGAAYEIFLTNCELEATIFIPREPQQIERCAELLHRSNQLNLTTRRYTKNALLQLLGDPRALCTGLSCRDRFGEYGIVGFASVHLVDDVPLLADFVLSCRVAKKKVENAWFRWLLGNLRRRLSCQKLKAIFIPTKRNSEMLAVLKEVGFADIEKQDGAVWLELQCERQVPASDIVRIVDETEDGFREARPGWRAIVQAEDHCQR
jgi:FkbH-like protein